MIRILAAASVVALCATNVPVFAQDYPNKAVRLIVPFAPGGPTDIVGRITAEYLSQRLGQPVVVENKPGAGTAIGLDLVAKSRADGYTLALATSDGLSILPALRSTLPYNAATDFEFVATVAKSSPVLAVPAKLPFKSVAELVAFGKENPAKIRYASSGVGSGVHLATALIAKVAGIEMVHVPYQGAAPAVTATVGGVVDLVLAGPTAIKPHSDSGALRVLATTDMERHPQFPEVPTLEQAGIKNLTVILYIGVVAPAGTPEPILARLGKELDEFGKDSTVSERLRAAGTEPSFVHGKAFKEFMNQDLARWKELVNSAQIVMPQ